MWIRHQNFSVKRKSEKEELNSVRVYIFFQRECIYSPPPSPGGILLLIEIPPRQYAGNIFCQIAYCLTWFLRWHLQLTATVYNFTLPLDDVLPLKLCTNSKMLYFPHLFTVTANGKDQHSSYGRNLVPSKTTPVMAAKIKVDSRILVFY
jgi:hypothetical protein